MFGSWSCVDPQNGKTAIHPRFKTHHYTSTCCNSQYDAVELCNDRNAVDGNRCSSKVLDALSKQGESVTCVAQSPSILPPIVCSQGKEIWFQINLSAARHMCASQIMQLKIHIDWKNVFWNCKGFKQIGAKSYIACLDGAMIQGHSTCNLCLHWETERNILAWKAQIVESNACPLDRSRGAEESNKTFAGYDGHSSLMAEESFENTQALSAKALKATVTPDSHED
jgi:hypothetical protein